MTYHGPCIECGKIINQQYIRKMCISCYQHFQRSDTFVPRKKYMGPCVECGSMSSPSNSFVRKMCSTCYCRYKEGRLNKPPTPPYDGPCITCGKSCKDIGHCAYKMCRNCYRKADYRKNNPPPDPEYCPDCGIVRPRKARNKRCRPCRRKYRWHTDPEYQKACKRRNKKYSQTDKGRQTQRNHTRKRRAQRAKIENTLTKKQWEQVLTLYNYRCAYCNTDISIEMDHIIPVSTGGPHSIHNVIPACRSCNSSKCAGPPPIPVQPVLL